MNATRFAFAGGYKFPMVEKAGLLVADMGGLYGWTKIVTDANETETRANGEEVNVAYRTLLNRVRLALSLRWKLGGEENQGTEEAFEGVK